MTVEAASKTVTAPKLTRREMMALRGLLLPHKLEKVGIRVEATISIEHQRLAGRYVLRGKECGGATSELGAYCGFVAEDGSALPWTQKIDTIGVNGVHAVVISPALVRVEVLRVEHTYDLLITRHSLQTAKEKGKKPRLVNEVIFEGRLGQLPLELWGRDKQLRGSVCPAFMTRSGEPFILPETFEEAVRSTVAGACCIGCRRHTHLLTQPRPRVEPAPVATTTEEVSPSSIAALS